MLMTMAGVVRSNLAAHRGPSPRGGGYDDDGDDDSDDDNPQGCNSLFFSRVSGGSRAKVGGHSH